MKKIVFFISVLFFTTSVFSQTYSPSRSMKSAKARKALSGDSFSADINFGFTNFFEDDLIYDVLRDNINFGVDIGVTKTFDSQFYVSGGLTFSILDDGVFDIWENTLNYFSFNADVGYTFKYHEIIEPYVAVGGSYVSTVLDNDFSPGVPDVINTYSINLVTGSVFWMGKSKNYGILVQHTFKLVNDEDMVSHNRFVTGIRFKI